MKPIDFKELAKLVDDWREADERHGKAETTRKEKKQPVKPDTFHSQGQYDAYMKNYAKWEDESLSLDQSTSKEYETMSNIKSLIWYMLNDSLESWFIVECKDKKLFGVYATYVGGSGHMVKIVDWSDKEAQADAASKKKH